jgi:proteasome activator subunit 4
MVDCLGQRFEPYADEYVQLFFDNADTGYAEVSFKVFNHVRALTQVS